jgi:AraC-like DNA-binding protein
LKQRLNSRLFDLFHKLTGLHLYARWLKPATARSQEAPAALCPRARRRKRRLPARCTRCLRARWRQAWNSPQDHNRFRGLCGSANYCAHLNVSGRRPLTLLVQQAAPVSRARKRAFDDAVRLARLLLHDLQTTLEEGQAPIPSLFKAEAGFPQAGCESARGGRHHQLVRRMLDFIHEHYSRPMQLADVAAALKMNTAYVSHLFSTSLGVTYGRYLEELRLAKAMELLRDPVNRVCEVAYAVGYADPNYFRAAFKASVGLAPSAWRQTAQPPPPDKPFTGG